MTEPSTGFSIGKLFEDPNFIAMLAGVGAATDPSGVGGILGNATTTLVRNRAAQSAAAKQLEEGRLEREDMRQQHRELMQRLGPITAPDRPGLNSIKPAKDGTVDIDIVPPDASKLVSDLNGFTALDEPGINSMSRSANGSTLVNYTLPKRRVQPSVADEVESLQAAPVAARDRSRLSYDPPQPLEIVAEVTDLLEPYTPRRRSL